MCNLKKFFSNQPSNLIQFLIAIFAGSLLPFAFAPHHYWPLAILSPAILALLWSDPSSSPNSSNQTITPKKAFSIGLVYGLGMFGVGVSWVYVSIHDFGNTDVPLAVFITLLLVVGLALFLACQGYLLKRLFKGKTLSFWLLGFPSSWVLFEWFRGWFLTGFPWLYLGYTQFDTPLAGYAPILSVFGVSTAVALTSGALAALVKGNLNKSTGTSTNTNANTSKKTNTNTNTNTKTNTNIKTLAILIIIIIWLGGQLLRNIEYVNLDPKTYTVSLVQGNVKPFDKFTQEDPIGSTEKIYGTLTKPNWDSDLIIWPEGAVPLPLPYSQSYIDILQKVAKAHHTTLLTGIQTFTPHHVDYNSLIALGEGSGLYHKIHLLPFGDFLPFENWLRGLIEFFNLPMSGFTAGKENQPLIQAGNLTIDPEICYEIAFPTLVRSTLRQANVIVNISEDGWFGKSWGPHQHLEIARMRALETGRYVLRATTSGITAIIDNKGRIIARIPQFEKLVLKGIFHSATGDTLWIKIGLWPLIIILLLAFILPGRLPFALHSKHN